MTQRELDRAVARATGEDVREIRRRGFGIADPIEANFNPEPDYSRRAIDWDDHDLQRNVSLVSLPIWSLRFRV